MDGGLDVEHGNIHADEEKSMGSSLFSSEAEAAEEAEEYIGAHPWELAAEL